MRFNPNNLSIRQLRSFMAVARNRSFSAAAKELFITPSALSESIRQLEETVGVRLLERTTRSVDMSVAGEEFYADIERLLASLDLTVLRMRDIGSGHRGLARVTGVASILGRLAAPCIARLLQEHPAISFDILEDGTYGSVSAVLDGRADIGICVVPERPPQGIHVHPLASDRYGIVAAKGHPAFQLKQLAIRSLKAWTFISVPMMGELSELVEVTVTPRARLNNLGTIVPLLESGAGISIFPYLGAQRVMTKNLDYRAFDAPKLSRQISLVRRQNRSLAPAAQLLWDRMVESAPALLLADLPPGHAKLVTLPQSPRPLKH